MHAEVEARRARPPASAYSGSARRAGGREGARRGERARRVRAGEAELRRRPGQRRQPGELRARAAHGELDRRVGDVGAGHRRRRGAPAAAAGGRRSRSAGAGAEREPDRRRARPSAENARDGALALRACAPPSARPGAAALQVGRTSHRPAAARSGAEADARLVGLDAHVGDLGEVERARCRPRSRARASRRSPSAACSCSSCSSLTRTASTWPPAKPISAARSRHQCASWCVVALSRRGCDDLGEHAAGARAGAGRRRASRGCRCAACSSISSTPALPQRRERRVDVGARW